MTASTALLVGPPGRARDGLAAVLTEGGFDVSNVTPQHLPVLDGAVRTPEVLLVSAAVGLREVAVICLRFKGDGVPPSTLVYPEDGADPDELETIVLAGYDYVTPPFRHALVRGRLRSRQEREGLTTAVEELSVAATVHRYERELSIAREIQSGFLPERLPGCPGWELAATLLPARHVSGDFYDVIELGNGGQLGLIVADVCDKGVGAALFMALIRTLLRHTAEHTDMQVVEDDEALSALGTDVAGRLQRSGRAVWLPNGAAPLVQAVAGTNRYLTSHHRSQAYFVTLFFGILDPDTGRLTYINGGHNPPVLARAAGGHEMLGPTGPAVGLVPDGVFSLGEVVLEPGDCLFVYTDGVVEAHDEEGQLFGVDRMLDVVGRVVPGRTAHGIVADVERTVQAYARHTEQFDDITMLALRRCPEDGPGEESPGD